MKIFQFVSVFTDLNSYLNASLTSFCVPSCWEAFSLILHGSHTNTVLGPWNQTCQKNILSTLWQYTTIITPKAVCSLLNNMIDPYQ